MFEKVFEKYKTKDNGRHNFNKQKLLEKTLNQFSPEEGILFCTQILNLASFSTDA